MQAGIGSLSGKEILRDDYNIGRFGEFDRFQDERDFMPEMFERPQSTIGGYDEQGYTLPKSQPDSWWWGYSRPDDVVEQERGVYPFVKRHAPEWSKDIYRNIKGGWKGTSLNPNINPRGMNRGIGSLDEYQMAELTDKQKNYMGKYSNTPDFGVSKEDLYGGVKDMENKPWDLQWGVQEPTTREEFEDYYRLLQAGEVGRWQT